MKRSRFLAIWLVMLLLAPQPAVGQAEPAISPSPLDLSITQAADPVSPQHDVTLRRKFEPELLKELLADESNAFVRGIVVMREQAEIENMALSGSRSQRTSTLVTHLQQTASRSQSALRQRLLSAQQGQQLKSFRPLWIVNGIAIQAQSGLYWELAARPDVQVILKDHVHHVPDTDWTDTPAADAQTQTDPVQWNIARVKADVAWNALQTTGEGIVVANLDTGVEWEHPLLRTSYRGYTGKPLVDHTDHWYCATDEGYLYPGDGHGHGTHTMGTIVGQDGYGVAPDARWIAVKIFDNQGLAYDSWIHAGLEWVLAPNGDPSLAPHVVNNSWGNPNSSYQAFRPDVQALRAAGILPVFSIGNYGPSAESTASPGSFPEAFAVGATDVDDLVARFSSRGPSPWNEIKPEISAPGVDVTSAAPGGGTASKGGTSMAAPHATGVVALILQANPTLTVDEVESILLQTAMPLGAEHPNNTYGMGLLDAYAAVTLAGQFGRIQGQVTDALSGAPIANAQISVTSFDATVTATTHTAIDGTYSLGLNANDYDLTASAFGYIDQTASLAVTMSVTTTHNVALFQKPTGTLAGTVREQGTDIPLTAEVYIPGTTASTTSMGSDGTYTLTLPIGTHQVCVEANAHRIVTATVQITAGETASRDFWLPTAPSILLVDSGAWYNASEASYYEQALQHLAYPYDLHTIANVDIAPTDVPTPGLLVPYDLVIWSAPSDSPGYIGAQDAITTFLEYGGGQLFLSGQDVAFWDGGGALGFWRDYLREYLYAGFVKDNATSRVLHGTGLFQGVAVTIEGQGGADNQTYPDSIASTDPDYAVPVFHYDQGGIGGLQVGPCLPYRAVYLSFGLEGINDAAAREQVLEQSIHWLDGPLVSAGIEAQIGPMPQIVRPGEWATHTIRLRNTGEVTADTYELGIQSPNWGFEPASPSDIWIGECQSRTLEVRVHVPSDAGWHIGEVTTVTAQSTLSPSLSAQVTLTTKSPAPVLLVDGSQFYHVDGLYRAALDSAGIPYDFHRIKHTWPVNYPSQNMLDTYPILVWYTAYDWYEPMTDLEEERIAAYLESGGRLFLSAQDFLFRRFDEGTLAREYLGVFDYRESVESSEVWGEGLHPIGWELGPHTLTYTYTDRNDETIPFPEAQVTLRDENNRPIALAHTGQNWRTSFAAFPVEMLDPDGAAELLDRTTGWLSWLGTSTWQASQRIVQTGDSVTMTGVLHNDGWQDVATATLTVALPAEVSYITGTVSPGATYDEPTRTISWQGGIAVNESVTVAFRVQVAGSLPDSSTISIPAWIGYADHALRFRRPYVLSVNVPDLSLSTLTLTPTAARPQSTVSATLAISNTGPADATAWISAVMPCYAVFTGTLDSGGIGTGSLISTTISWTGPVAAGEQVTLRYGLATGSQGNYWLVHRVRISDQSGDRWYPEDRVEITLWETFMPLVAK